MSGPVGVRTLLLWCPDWPVVAAEIVDGVVASGAVAVLHGNRVLACSEAARADGVRRGLRRREAQSRCPQLVVVDHDPGRDARAFEPVVAAVEEVAVGVEVIRPGACALAARGPSRYFGGEELAAERIVEQVAQACAVESQVGIADGVFAAGLAARSGTIVASGRTREFLAAVPVDALERPELADLLRRLGVKSLGDFAALPASDVLTRFGFDGALAHRLAGGLDHRPLAVRQPPPDLDVSDTYDEPLERVDVAAFAGRVLAERLHDRLAAHGLACTRLGIEAVTADGQELHRVWRHEGLLTAAAIAERVRWQLDGWLTGARRGAPNRPTAGLVRLRLVPDGVLVHLGLQPGLWGDAGAERERAHRALSRIQGLLGPEAVLTAVLGGGRSADDQVRLVPWGDERTPDRPTGEPATPLPALEPAVVALTDPPALVALPAPPAEKDAAGSDGRPKAGDEDAAGSDGRPKAGDEDAAGGDNRQRAGDGGAGGGGGRRGTGKEAVRGRQRKRPVPMPPWPGRLPSPAPALVLPQALPAVVLDADRRPVGVSARLELTGDPAYLLLGAAGAGAPVEITGWAGPWPVDERWWAPAEARRRARFQVVLGDGRALLLSLVSGHWAIEAIYD
ncbi:DNA repair protein [Actinoplanes sp. ATCC 53533]|uniref:DNA polymerase Y family protein n=1 Tax=Actinoplanes sp. ATCC 53533 TaxID=1288362 RepID=UPI000F77C944|nr:DNA polymerase Y family protein [Actinoplanes sp. ATCC 53533]RSM69204.1 DNA repair protein [Actinoplanes sp. ATCC 53533]